MSDELTQDYIKIILLGESGVGKTNLINVAVGNTFNANSHSSLTSSYFKGSILINKKEFIYIKMSLIKESKRIETPKRIKIRRRMKALRRMKTLRRMKAHRKIKAHR